MGSALGARLRHGGARALVALDGRSERSRQPARDAGLENVGTLGALLSRADVVLSVVPPGSAEEVAARIAEATGDAQPLVADLNAIAPAAAQRVAAMLAKRRIDFVDGSISGPPPRARRDDRLSLRRACRRRREPASGVELRVVGERPVGCASAVKMSTGSFYKGARRCSRRRSGRPTRTACSSRCSTTSPRPSCDHDRAASMLARAAAKSGRYVAEMREIAPTQAGRADAGPVRGARRPSS